MGYLKDVPNLRFLLTFVVCVASCICLFSCDQELLDQARSVKAEWASFRENLQKAKENLQEVVTEIEVLQTKNFNSEDTESFIEDAREKIKQIRSLKEDFKSLVKSVDFLFAFAYRKAHQTKDPKLRQEYLEYIAQNKKKFVDILREAHLNIENLDRQAQELQDILNGIEIAAAMHLVSEKLQDINYIINKMIAEIQETEELIQRGYAILNRELNEGG